MTAGAPFVAAVAGWKNSGKTTLVTRLVSALSERGYRVSTIKHSHHAIAFETDGTDSARHQAAGARQVIVVSPAGWALVGAGGELALHPDPAPSLNDIVAHFQPTDVVLVEGMKQAPIPKIEARRGAQGSGPPLAPGDPLVFAIAADQAASLDAKNAGLPVFSLDDVEGLTQALLTKAGLAERKAAPDQPV